MGTFASEKNTACGGMLGHLPVCAGCFRFADGVFLPLEINAELRGLLRLDDDEIAAALTDGSLPFVHPEEADRLRLLLYKARVGGGSFRDTARIRADAARWSWMELRVKGEQIPGDGCVVSLLLTDLNVRMERQRRLDDTYTRLLDVMNNTPGGIVAFDTLNNRTLVPFFASQGMERLLRGRRDELENAYRQNPYRCVHPEDREKLVRTIEDSLRNLAGFQLSLRLRRIDGEYVWVSASGMIEKVSNQRLVYMALIDSSEDKRNQEIQKRILDNFVRRQYEHICLIDGARNSYRVLSTNACSEQFLPASGEDYEREITRLIHENVIAAEQENVLSRLRLSALLEALSHRDDLEYTFSTLAPDGRRHCKRVWVSWIDRETQTIAFISGDVTEEYRRSEESRAALLSALRAAQQANSAKSEFLSRMSHDIRTPLNAIIGYTEMSLEDPSLSAGVRDHLQKADSSSKFLLSLINDILNMSRIESGKLALNEAPFSFGLFVESISAVVASQCESKRIGYSCRMEKGLRESYVGDRLKLQQILLNIIGNAVKFTPEGGSILLQIGECRLAGTEGVRFTVKDTGRGIAREFLPSLFDPFAQEKSNRENEAHGTGLGLAICKSLTEMMGGTISVESELGKGSRFCVEIPLRAAAAGEGETLRAGPPEPSELDCDFGGLRILLAEDNELNTEIAVHVLEKAHLLVDTAANGQIACERFAASPVGYYAAILMDIRMPVMDGLHAAEKIRALPRGDSRVPIIAMSANAFEEDVRQALASGMNAYTIKPIDTQQLYAALRKLIK